MQIGWSPKQLPWASLSLHTPTDLGSAALATAVALPKKGDPTELNCPKINK